MSSLTVSKTTRPPAPAGQHAAVCVDVFDAGWWKKLESEEFVQKVKLLFLIDALDENGRPYYVDLFETLSVGQKANLRKHLASWRGRDFTAEELKGFDLEKLIGVPCLLQIVHKESGGELRARISTVMGLPKAMRGALPKVPADFKREKDRPVAEQFATKHPKPASKAAPAVVSESGAIADEDDDLPF